MKRFICLLTGISVACVALFGGMGCKKEIKDAAEKVEILLAQEHLGETVIDSSLNVWANIDAEASANAGAMSVRGDGATTAQSAPYAATAYAAADENGFSEENDYYQWTKFPAHSETLSFYETRLNGVQENAVDAATIIGKFKSDVQITDKWVKGAGSSNQYLMQVKSDGEYLYERQSSGDSYNVSRRYTEADATNVYETYERFDDNGTWGNSYSKYVENEYYEWSYDHSNDYNDYVVVEKSKGYWTLMSMNTYNNTEFSFNTCVVKDGLGYGAYMQTRADVSPSAQNYTAFDPETGREFFRAIKYLDYWVIELSLSAIKSGLQAVRAYGDIRDLATDAKGVYEYEHGAGLTLITDGGTFEYEDVINGVQLGETRIQYNAPPADVLYYGAINFKVEADSFTECEQKLAGCLREMGIQTYYDSETVNEGMYLAQLLGEEFASIYSWNGYPLDSLENAVAARRVLLNKYDAYRALYEEVKDNETTQGRQKLPKDAKFAAIDTVTGGQSEYANGTIEFAETSVKLTDTSLLESGMEYRLQIGLAKVNDENAVSSVNAVDLTADGTIPTTTFEQGDSDITVTRGGSFEIPSHLAEGRYAVVAYVASSDGYRVSEMKPLAFYSVEQEQLDSAVMDVTVETVGETLFVEYNVSLFIKAELTAGKAYTGEEVRAVLLRKAIACGYPKSGESLQTADGTSVDLNVTLGAGEYRLKIYMSTEQGLVEAYVYCVI